MDAKDKRLSSDQEGLLAEIERVHGPEVAAVARKAIAAGPPPPHRPVPRTEGHGREGPHRGGFVYTGNYRESVAVKDGGTD